MYYYYCYTVMMVVSSQDFFKKTAIRTFNYSKTEITAFAKLCVSQLAVHQISI